MNVWNVFKCCCMKLHKTGMHSVYKNDFGRYSWNNSEFVDDV